MNDVADIRALDPILDECYGSHGQFCRTFLSDNFYVKFSALHNQILTKMDYRKPRKKVAICATRGIGKTTLARAKAAHGILFADRKFIVYLGKSATHAEMQTENLKKDLMGKDVREVFGNVKTKLVGEVEESWSKKTWVAHVGAEGSRHYTLVLPRGAGQQIRGLLWKGPDGRNVRPDLIVADDMEESEPAWIENEENRRKLKEWFFSDVLHCFNRLDPMWEIFYIDTLKHEDALMKLLLDSMEWDSTTISLCDENYKTTAPEFLSQEELNEMIESYRAKGMMDVFAREIMCMPISREDAVFKPEYFKYYSESDEKWIREVLPHIISIVIVDPAKTAKRSSAESGFVVWGIDTRNGNLYMRYAMGERLHPDEIEQRAIQLCRTYKARIIGVETTGISEFITHPFANALIQAGLGAELVELKAKRGQGEFSGAQGGKKMRISSLQGYYRKGQIHHNKDLGESGIGAYETQLLGFPRSKRWDIMDAAAYITEMLEMGNIYWLVSGIDEEDPTSVEEEYAELETEEYLPDEKVQSWERPAP